MTGAERHTDSGGMADGLDRLWTPHRMTYISGEDRPAEGYEKPTGCPFCRARGLPPEESLVVARGEHVFAVLNLYPYNPGHLLVCPYRHVADYTDLDQPETIELAAFTQTAMRVIRKVSSAHGFNLGHEPGRGGRRRHRRPPAPARGAALGRRRQLHAGDRPHQGPAAAARRHPRPARPGLAA